MIKELMYKMFGLEPMQCPVCEVLSSQLEKSERERRELLQRALAPRTKEPIPPMEKEELEPIKSQHIPWRIRQQLYEAEDRKKAELMKRKNEEIAELEKELGVPQ